MYELLAQVLAERDLSIAGELFYIPDSAIVNDLTEALYRIQDITAAEDYLTNRNDQTVVEICITRVTTAIRDTGTIDKHAMALVYLWDSCLHHNLIPTFKDEDPPHAKIASDIMSCLFMQNYNKKSVMKLALPVAVKFLQQGNREITRNLSTYLALAAIENAEILIPHTGSLIRSIRQGNRSLLRILPQIYSESNLEIVNYISELVVILPKCSTSEKLSILQIFAMIQKKYPHALRSHVAVLVEQLNDPSVSSTILNLLLDIATVDAKAFIPCLHMLKVTVAQQTSLLSLAAKIFAAIGKLNEDYGRECMTFLVQQLTVVEQSSVPAVLIEIKSISDYHKGLLSEHMPQINSQQGSSSTAVRMIVQQLQDDLHKRKGRTFESSKAKSHSALTHRGGGITHSTVSLDFETRNLQMKNRIHSQVSVDTFMNPRKHFDTKSLATRSLEVGPLLSPKVDKGPELSGSKSSLQSNPQQSRPQMRKFELSPPKPDASGKHWDPNKRVSRKDGGSRTNLIHQKEVREMLMPNSRDMEMNSLSIRGESLGSGPIHNSKPGTLTRTAEKKDSSLQQYLTKRRKEIISYIESVKKQLPVPTNCKVIESKDKKPVGQLEFHCGKKGIDCCMYQSTPFTMATKEIQTWIYIMYLHLQATSPSPVAVDDESIQVLKRCWEKQKTTGGTMPFLKLITQNFPSTKVQNVLIQQLNEASYYDLFKYDRDCSSWVCFMCCNPTKLADYFSDGQPHIEGQLKEKKVRWKLFRTWRTRYFSLSGESLIYKKNKSSPSKGTLPVELGKVQSVKAVRRRDRSIPKAFEIFTEDNKSYVFKAKDSTKAEQWVQCLTIAVHQANTKQ
ncbi:ventricular zone-expressed PH domain-containing protein homolog 1-like [Antedon mediterranea]|uniref:ventricular zone-expressed PH domain-containing protein homolog 1-like n=1 Tax=Antedon mediterranea TaxID=105859 RepID=UPI003AF535FB